MAYRFTDHTADYGVEVNAFTAEEAFCDAVRAMYEILFGGEAARLFRVGNKGTPGPISLAEESLADLLHAWLSWHLDRYTQDRRVASGWRVRIDFRQARLTGETYLQDAGAMDLKPETEIKAVTYHNLKAFASLERTQLHYIVDV
ncbi:archease [bacterium]|nr:archease [bacterium]